MFDIVTTLPFWQDVETPYALSTSPILVAANEPQRVIIYFTAQTGTDIFIWKDPPVPIGSGPQIVVPAGTTLRFTWELDGPMSTFPWLAYVPSGTGQIVVTEIYWRPRR